MIQIMRAAVLVLFAFLIACEKSDPVKEKQPDAKPAEKPAEKTADKPAAKESAGADIDNDPIDEKPLKLTSHQISLDNGKTFKLNIPEGFDIKIAAQGLKRVRFMAKSPDGRIFVADMFNLTDNQKGIVYILDEFNSETGKFGAAIPYITNQRNPNSIAFHTDKNGDKWLYVALTDKLVRYKFSDGDQAPSGLPETLATYPDYGLSYKYGGWHLTRTVVIGPNEKVYVSAGSSCNVCEEKEEIRATVGEMDLDGKNQKIIARGLRNAVGMKFVNGKLFVANMGSDHLGDDRPEETMYIIKEGANYGWPYCYEYKSKIYSDDKLGPSEKRIDCSTVPPAYASFAAHSSPLGLEYFDSTAVDPALKNYFLAALHGSSKKSLNRGYRISRIKRGRPPEDFITGFQQGEEIHGRPADVMRIGPDAFLFTDDHAGVIYYVYRKAE